MIPTATAYEAAPYMALKEMSSLRAALNMCQRQLNAQTQRAVVWQLSYTETTLQCSEATMIYSKKAKKETKAKKEKKDKVCSLL